MKIEKLDNIDALMAARVIADLAYQEGVCSMPQLLRASCEHLGAVLADSVLQAGLNYKSVVRPRIERILSLYPNAAFLDGLTEIVNANSSAKFLNWSHYEKISRFENLVLSMREYSISNVKTLRNTLVDEKFCEHLQGIHGVGPKTIDYMACLVGLESIAVDRHIRAYAKRAGLEHSDYYFLKKSFCFAADLLSISRRGFDAWIWKKESEKESSQFALAV